MTRKSKREIERALADLDESRSAGPVDHTPKIEKCRSDEVVSLTYGVCRDLMRLCYRNADSVINESDDGVATERYLELVREEYDMDDDADRDERVLQTLVESVNGDRYNRPMNAFEMAPVAVVTHLDVVGEDGTELAALVDAGRNREAECLIVQTTYDLLANRHQRGITVQ